MGKPTHGQEDTGSEIRRQWHPNKEEPQAKKTLAQGSGEAGS